MGVADAPPQPPRRSQALRLIFPRTVSFLFTQMLNQSKDPEKGSEPFVGNADLVKPFLDLGESMLEFGPNGFCRRDGCPIPIGCRVGSCGRQLVSKRCQNAPVLLLFPVGLGA
jgi:hypothetical protein